MNRAQPLVIAANAGIQNARPPPVGARHAVPNPHHSRERRNPLPPLYRSAMEEGAGGVRPAISPGLVGQGWPEAVSLEVGVRRTWISQPITVLVAHDVEADAASVRFRDVHQHHTGFSRWCTGRPVHPLRHQRPHSRVSSLSR